MGYFHKILSFTKKMYYRIQPSKESLYPNCRNN